ncbi:hypothetical protein K491DRAFT_717767 [Lophiostoma macrostomum CBS 122681]|uniref:Uncharacterized protein n=1 Tax=Lophiostoma macrostomum CBS 122681 TaxID=1314788 RepID=A0A6A6T222_9PLEO|nr:hypothetical protein K491DRAFT_717767 [Lophiostoma macrostomum CBS 122681]
MENTRLPEDITVRNLQKQQSLIQAAMIHEEQLKTKLAKVQEDRRRHACKLEEMLETHCGMQCRQIYDKMYSTLPREVRDEIYQYILLSDGGVYFDCDYWDYWALVSSVPVVWLAQHYLSSDVYHELAEFLYQTATFCFGNDSRWRDSSDWGSKIMKRVLHETDCNGFIRAHKVRKLQLTVILDDIYSKPSNEQDAFEEFIGEISVVLDCKMKVSLQLRINCWLRQSGAEAWTPPNWPQDWAPPYVPFLEGIFGILRAIMKAGHEVKILVENNPINIYEYVLQDDEMTQQKTDATQTDGTQTEGVSL